MELASFNAFDAVLMWLNDQTGAILLVTLAHLLLETILDRINLFFAVCFIISGLSFVSILKSTGCIGRITFFVNLS